MKRARSPLALSAPGLAALALLLAAGQPPVRPTADAGVVRADLRANRPLPPVAAEKPAAPAGSGASARPATTTLSAPVLDPQQAARSLSTVALFGLVSLAPAAVLMLT